MGKIFEQQEDDNFAHAAIFQGYFGVIPENMTVPSALFLSEKQAREYAKGIEVRKYPASSLLFEVLCQSGNNP